jgi:class 3 adenylate cyclase
MTAICATETSVKRTGDGSVIEFRSVVDAVRCAPARVELVAKSARRLGPE